MAMLVPFAQISTAIQIRMVAGFAEVIEEKKFGCGPISTDDFALAGLLLTRQVRCFEGVL
jgi:hypothetical protein